MKGWRFRRSLSAASMFCLLAAATAHAQQTSPGELDALKKMVEEVLSQNEELKRRVRELEEAMAKRGPAPAEAPKEAVEAPKEAVEAPKDAVPPAAEPPGGVLKAAREKIQLGGALEVEYVSRREFNRLRTQEIALTTAEFDFEADVVDWAKAELSLQWDSVADKITLNEGLITFAKPSLVPVYGKTGRGVVPFGISTGTSVAARLEESLTITGPLTTEVFEAKEDYALVGVKWHGLNGSVYAYNGTTDNAKRGTRLEHWGASAAYGMKTDLLSFDLGVGWIDSVFDTDGLTAAFPEMQKRPNRPYIPGISAYAKFGMFGFSLIGEYDGATRTVHFTRTKRDVRALPKAWQIEVGYSTKIFGIRPFAAVNYSGTSGMLAAFPQLRLLGVGGAWLTDNIRIALEYAYEEDYPKVAFGTGKTGDAWTLRLTYEW